MSLKYFFVVIGIVLAVMHSVHSASLEVPIEENGCICTRELFPICGANGITYSNLCMFECEKEKHKELEMLFEGDCDNEY